MTTVSDASETGGGFCHARALTDEGRLAFTADLARPAAVGRDRIALLTLADDLGGMRQALDNLGIEVTLFAVTELAPIAWRVVAAAWPDVSDCQHGGP